MGIPIVPIRLPDLHDRAIISDTSLANQIVFVRIWGDFGQQGTFNICAHDPSVGASTCNPCDSIFIPPGVFEGDTTFIACDSINSSQTIQNGMGTTMVNYEAGIEITLKAGFLAKNGVTFIAKIEDHCNSPFTEEKDYPAHSRTLDLSSNKAEQFDLTVYPNPFQTTLTLNKSRCIAGNGNSIAFISKIEKYRLY